MSGHFPRLNLDRPADLDHVLHAIDQHAHKVAQMEFGSELERDKALRAVVDKMFTRVSPAQQAAGRHVYIRCLHTDRLRWRPSLHSMFPLHS